MSTTIRDPSLRTYPGVIMTWTDINSIERDRAYTVYQNVPKWALFDMLYEAIALRLSFEDDYEGIDDAIKDSDAIMAQIAREYKRIR